MLIDLFSFLQQITFLQGVGGLVLLIIGLLLIGGGLDGRLTLLAVTIVWFATSMLLLDVVPAVQAFTRIITGVTITLLLLRVLWLDENLRWFSWRRLSYVAVLMGLALLVTQFVESYLPDSLLLYIATILTLTVGIISIVSVTNRVLVGIGLLLILLFVDVMTAAFYPSEPLAIMMATVQIVTAFATTWLTAAPPRRQQPTQTSQTQPQPLSLQSEPLQPESPQPVQPVQPEPSQPQPVQPEPSQPQPVQPEPPQPQPVQPEPSQPQPVQPEPPQPQPVQPEPPQPEPPQSEPSQPLPSQQPRSSTRRRKRRRRWWQKRTSTSESPQPLPLQPLKPRPSRRRRRRRRRPRQRLS